MRRTKADAARTREQLLDAALATFHAKGYAASTLDDIARRAGITRGAIAWHFGSKAELFNAVIRECYVRATLRMFARQALVRAQGGTPLQVLRRDLLHWLTLLEDDPEFRAVHELTLQTPLGADPEAGELAAGMRERVEGMRRARAYFAGLIQQAIASGEVRRGVDPEVAATTALGLTNGVGMIWLLDPTAFTLAARGQEVVDLLLQGLEARAP